MERKLCSSVHLLCLSLGRHVDVCRIEGKRRGRRKKGEKEEKKKGEGGPCLSTIPNCTLTIVLFTEYTSKKKNWRKGKGEGGGEGGEQKKGSSFLYFLYSVNARKGGSRGEYIKTRERGSGEKEEGKKKKEGKKKREKKKL